jgi:hypothetical protein
MFGFKFAHLNGEQTSGPGTCGGFAARIRIWYQTEISRLLQFLILFFPSTGGVDTSVANSALITSPLVAGVGSQSLSISLKAPDLIGVGSGPEAASPRSMIWFQQKDPSGNWIGTNFWTSTTEIKSGAYSAYLPTGTYRGYADASFAVARRYPRLWFGLQRKR